MQSQGEKLSADVQRVQTQHMTDLFNIGAPGFKLALSDFMGDLGQPGQEPASVRNAFAQIRKGMNQQYDTAGQAMPGAAQYQATASGYRGAEGAIPSATDQALFSLEAQRRAQNQLLTIQETNAGMQQRDFDLSQILGLGAGGFQSSLGFTQNALQSARYAGGNPWGGALSGAASGAATGALFGGVGAPIGAIAGGLLGYFSGGGG